MTTNLAQNNIRGDSPLFKEEDFPNLAKITTIN
jgi:hypothetical protein